jgi:PAS domain S-box-containing protein
MSEREQTHVLLIDDDRQWAELLAEGIVDVASECEVTLATSAEKALEKLPQHDIDCVVSDYQMPGANGIELLDQIRDIDSQLPFMLVTSQGCEDVAARAIEAGVDDYVIKEFGSQQATRFVNKIRTTVDQYRLQQALEESEQRYRTVTEQNRDAVVVLDEFRLVFCNDRATELLGRGEDELRGEDVIETAIHREDRARLREQLPHWEDCEIRPRLEEARIVRPDGTVRNSECTGRQITVDGQQRLLVSLRDVTERNRRERELQWERQLNRTVQQVLVNSETKDELESQIVQQLRDHGYPLAWIGEQADGELLPRVVRGEQRYVEAVDKAIQDGGRTGEPATRAAATGEAQFCQDIDEIPACDWRETAQTYSYQSCAAVPLTYNDVFYGVLAVYHGQSGRFDDTEQRLLRELGDTVALAIHTLETQSALSSNQVFEAKLQIRSGYYLVDIARSGGFRDCDEITVQGTVLLKDETVVQYLAVRSGDAEVVRDKLETHAAVEDVVVVDGRSPARLRVTVSEPVPEAMLARRGRDVQVTTVEETCAILTVEVPARQEIRQLVDHLKTTVGSVNISAISEQTDENQAASGFTIGMELLTDKQRSALKVAYFNGYFEQPRQASATEVAELLGVSHSTFLRHLRTAQQKTFGVQFDQES